MRQSLGSSRRQPASSPSSCPILHSKIYSILILRPRTLLRLPLPSVSMAARFQSGNAGLNVMAPALRQPSGTDTITASPSITSPAGGVASVHALRQSMTSLWRRMCSVVHEGMRLGAPAGSLPYACHFAPGTAAAQCATDAVGKMWPDMNRLFKAMACTSEAVVTCTSSALSSTCVAGVDSRRPGSRGPVHQEIRF